jgi:transcription initiation factor IIF auxiliary subunit
MSSKNIESITITIVNTSIPDEDDPRYFIWTVYIKTDPPVYIQRIKKVVYHLHPTFTQREIPVEDKSGGFKLMAKGWGGFTIKLEVIRDDDKKVKLRHYLSLGKEGGNESINKLNEDDFE